MVEEEGKKVERGSCRRRLCLGLGRGPGPLSWMKHCMSPTTAAFKALRAIMGHEKRLLLLKYINSLFSHTGILNHRTHQRRHIWTTSSIMLPTRLCSINQVGYLPSPCYHLSTNRLSFPRHPLSPPYVFAATPSWPSLLSCWQKPISVAVTLPGVATSCLS